MQDHFIACSYINEKGIYSIVSQDHIILGFDTLESGAILGMGNTDIDSIGEYSKSYSGPRRLQEGNGQRAKYFVPTDILKTINDGYNEIVIERRNPNQFEDSEFKRKPNYIIMMAESMEQNNFNHLETLYQNQLSFISEEDRKEIQKISKPKELKNFLVKYKSIISQIAKANEITLNNMANMLVDLIMKAKYYEECLKAASEFDIPLVVVDRAYYFNKILDESVAYSDEEKQSILEFYLQANENNKKSIFNIVAKGGNISKIIQAKANSHGVSIGI